MKERPMTCGEERKGERQRVSEREREREKRGREGEDMSTLSIHRELVETTETSISQELLPQSDNGVN